MTAVGDSAFRGAGHVTHMLALNPAAQSRELAAVASSLSDSAFRSLLGVSFLVAGPLD